MLAVRGSPLRREQRALELLRRPELDHAILTALPSVGERESDTDEPAELGWQIVAQVEIHARYAGYLQRQQEEIERSHRYRATALPENLDYAAVRGLSNELRQKLSEIQPATLDQASRISGMTPAAISMLLVHLKKLRLRSA
jgi:tRNA uridine 5-carboxymethylaminomethyl modification enzyme